MSEYEIYKGVRGWKAVKFFDIPGGDLSIQLIVMKRSNGNIVASVNAGHVAANSFSYMPFSDYSASLISVKKRSSEPAVRSIMEEAIRYMPSVIEKVVAFYKEKEVA